MSALTRDDFEVGITMMVDVHPAADVSPQERYDMVTSTMEEAGFSPYELRGMLAVAVDRLRHGTAETKTEELR